MKRLAVAGAVCVALALSTAACSDDDDSPEGEATHAAGELCEDLRDLRSDADELAALKPASATKEQIEDAYNDVREDWDDAQEHVTALDVARKDAVQKAADDLRSAYDGVPDDATVPQVIDGVKAQAEKLTTTVTAASSSLKCP